MSNAELSLKLATRQIAVALVVGTCASNFANCVMAATDYRDTLDRAVGAPNDADIPQADQFIPFVADSLSYDRNLFRLPANADIATIVGPNASRHDYTNTASAGLDAQWLAGNRQSIDLDLRADYNRFQQNDDLNNLSTTDRLVWNWGLGGVISGQVGADYSRYLTSFVNTAVYTRNLINQSEYFAAARFQMGPRWALFGGLLAANNSLTAAQSTGNNSHRKSVDLGAEYATGAADSIGFDYRYTDSRYPNSIDIGGTTFDPDFREERTQVLVKYVVSDKTSINATAGYLKRDYSSTTIGSFSGEIWRASLEWLPTLKTGLEVTAWRQLQADLTADTDYFVSKGALISPIWNASDKIRISFGVSRDARSYIGSNPGASAAQARRDTVTAEQASILYKATRALTINGGYVHEKRSSNLALFQFDDDRANVGLTFKF